MSSAQQRKGRRAELELDVWMSLYQAAIMGGFGRSEGGG